MTTGNNALAVREAPPGMPVLSIDEAAERHNAIVSFVQKLMTRDADYGVIPGTGGKPTLLKPGAEKLCAFFGLHPKFEDAGSVVDWSRPFFHYSYRCILQRNGEPMGEGIGSCNSMEAKYRWRNSARKCPECGKEAIIKGKEEYGGGWLCFKKKGGCGAKWPDGAKIIESQSAEKVENPDVADCVNTVQKMAQKRALVAAVLVTVGASQFFTQDVEDMGGQFVGDGEAYEPPRDHKPVENTAEPRAHKTQRVNAKIKERNGQIIDEGEAHPPPATEPHTLGIEEPGSNDHPDKDPFDGAWAVFVEACEAEFQRRKWPPSKCTAVIRACAGAAGFATPRTVPTTWRRTFYEQLREHAGSLAALEAKVTKVAETAA